MLNMELENNNFEGCKECTNLGTIDFLGKDIPVCMANMDYPEKCVLNKNKKKGNNDR